MKRLLLPLLVLASGLCRGQSSPAFSFSTLPEWETSASGPLRPLPAGYRLLEYVESTGAQWIDMGSDVPMSGSVSFDLTLTSVPNGAGIWGQQVTGTRILVYFRSMSVGFFEAGTAGTINFSTLPSVSVHDKQYGGSASAVVPRHLFTTTTGTGGARTTRVRAKLRSFALKTENGAFVRDYVPVADANGVAGLWDRVSGQMIYSATATPLVAGPEIVDLDSGDPLLPSSRNWYRAWLSATNPPAPAAGSIVLDTLVLPVGIYSPIRDQPSALVEAIVAEPSMLKALVQRYRSGLAPTNIPVTVAHSPTNVVGSVSNLWWVEGEGVWARLRVSSVIYGSHASCEIYGLRAQATDAWGTWGDFFLPWQIRAVSLVAKPALATPVAVPLPAEPAAPYPGRIRP